MDELLLGTLSTLAGTALGGGLAYYNSLLQHQRERKAVAQDRLRNAIESAERVLLSIKHVQRIQFSLQQAAGESELDNGMLANELRSTLADNRASMEESMLTLRSICSAYFHGADVTIQLDDLERTSRNAFVSSGEVASHRNSRESVERSVSRLKAAMSIEANKYKG